MYGVSILGVMEHFFILILIFFMIHLTFLCTFQTHAKTVMICNVFFSQGTRVAELTKENARDLFSHLCVS